MIDAVGIDQQEKVAGVLRVLFYQDLIDGYSLFILAHVLVCGSQVLLEQRPVVSLLVRILPGRALGLLQQAGEYLRGLRRIAALLVAGAKIELRLRVAGVLFEHRLEALNCLGNLSRSQPGPAQLGEGGRVRRCGLNHRLQNPDGILKLAGIHQRRSQLALNRGIVSRKL